MLYCPISNIFEICYPILICLYLSSLISYRKVFVLQTELLILLFKWIMSQSSIMFVAGEIKQKQLHKFNEVFFTHPLKNPSTVISLSDIWLGYYYYFTHTYLYFRLYYYNDDMPLPVIIPDDPVIQPIPPDRECVVSPCHNTGEHHIPPLLYQVWTIWFDWQGQLTPHSWNNKAGITFLCLGWTSYHSVQNQYHLCDTIILSHRCDTIYHAGMIFHLEQVFVTEKRSLQNHILYFYICFIFQINGCAKKIRFVYFKIYLLWRKYERSAWGNRVKTLHQYIKPD